MVKGLIPSQRPFVLGGVIPMTLTIPTDGSFPSGHSAAAFGLATSVWLHNKKIGFAFIISSFLVALGRVIGNVHFFLDVLAGGFIGIITAYIFDRLHFYKLLSKRS